MQVEPWVLLEKDEYDRVWDEIYRRFEFSPSIDPNWLTFEFQVKYSEYKYDSSLSKNIDSFNFVIKTILSQCMDRDDYIYALDWQHSCFRYNPNSKIPLQKLVRVDDDSMSGFHNIYFPEFYPDGDYYFFIAKDFSWGYLTHPWQKKCWVFGDCIMEEFKIHSKQLFLVPC